LILTAQNGINDEIFEPGPQMFIEYYFFVVLFEVLFEHFEGKGVPFFVLPVVVQVFLKAVVGQVHVGFLAEEIR
jgi:hypothetical protein